MGSSTTVIATVSITVRTTATLSPTGEAQYTHGLNGTNQIGNFLFVNLLIAFFAITGTILIGVRLFRLAENHMRHVVCTGAGRDNQDYWLRNRTNMFPWIKRYVLYAPLWNKRHNREWQLSKAYNVGTLPSRLHFSVLWLYFLSNVAYSVILDYSKPRSAIIAELRGRTGALAAFNLIPTVLFALRNNPLIPVLRVSYDTFNLLHRSVARIAILEAVAHTLCWSINAVDINGAHSIGNSLKEPFFAWGTVGTLLLILLGLMAWSPFRHAFYETFLNTHRIFALVVFLAVYEHLIIGGLPQIPYIILTAVFWGAEWAARLGRVAFYNFTRHHTTCVTVEALPKDACRVTFDLVRHWKYTPGSHVHVYLPRIGLWSSHPFSLAWSEDLNVPMMKDEEKGVDIRFLESRLDAQHNVTSSVSCIVRAESGMTRKLFNRAANAPNRIISLRGAIEGPYGGHESLDSYGTVLLFCGGVGITHQLGFVRQLVQGHRDGTVAARKVVLVWSITYVECLEWVRPYMDDILKIDGRRDVLQVNLHVTRGTVDVSSKTGRVMMFKGRCDVQKTVDEVFLERQGAMIVTVCGPGSFSDDVRHAVRKRVDLGAVDFVEEAFTY